MSDLVARGAANPQTIRTLREIHEGCMARHFQDPDWKIKTGGSVCARCSRIWPCDDHKDAVAALDLLDNADERFRPPSWKMSDAPQERFRLVPDPPAPRGDADA